jgi:hypothetical protein
LSEQIDVKAVHDDAMAFMAPVKAVEHDHELALLHTSTVTLLTDEDAFHRSFGCRAVDPRLCAVEMEAMSSQSEPSTVHDVECSSVVVVSQSCHAVDSGDCTCCP